MPVGGSQLVQQANEHTTYYKSLKKSGCTSVVPNRLGKVFPVPGNSIPIRLGMLFPTVGNNRGCSKVQSFCCRSDLGPSLRSYIAIERSSLCVSSPFSMQLLILNRIILKKQDNSCVVQIKIIPLRHKKTHLRMFQLMKHLRYQM